MKKNKFQLKREATYHQLIESGMRCFMEKGYAATTIVEIAQRTGHTNGAFYAHFPSKEAFFFDIIRYRQQLRDGWTCIPPSFNPAENTLEEVLVYVLKRLGELIGDDANWSVIMVEFHRQIRHDPELCDTLADQYRLWVQEIEQFVRTLIDRGWVSRQKDSYRTAAQLLALSDGFAVNEIVLGRENGQAVLEGMSLLLRD